MFKRIMLWVEGDEKQLLTLFDGITEFAASVVEGTTAVVHSTLMVDVEAEPVEEPEVRDGEEE